MGLLDKALKLQKGLSDKPVSMGKKVVQKKTSAVRTAAVVAPPAKQKTKPAGNPIAHDELALRPHISLSTGKVHLPESHHPKPDYQPLVENINKTLAAKSAPVDFGKVKEQIQKKLTERKLNKVAPRERVPTGIPGLDDVTEGGLVKNSCTLIGGGAGSGKTIFCMQFLVNGIDKYNEPGIFISFEDHTSEIVKDFDRFSWNIVDKIKRKKLIMLHFTPEEVSKFLESGGGIVRDSIESIGAKRVVIDSLTAFTLLFKDELATRKSVLTLFESMNKWGVTTLLTSEQEPDPEKHSSTIMEFEVDSVILLYNLRKGDVRERSLEVFKMRATQHSAKIFPMKIESAGIIIYPEETIF